MENRPAGDPGTENDRPPVFGSWRRLYFVVLTILAVLIAVFYLVTKVFE